MSSVPEKFVETAIAAADAARLVTARYFRARLDIVSKHDHSPVTIADHETEQIVKNLILDRHPSHSFLGEESGVTNNEDEWCWVIDPIDGTKSFATGNPTFGTLVALLHHDQPVIGVIDHMALDERWIGIKSQGTTRNGQPCTTSKVSQLTAASIYTTTLDMFSDQTLEQFNRLSRACQFRVFGGDCYGYSLLSSGFTELVCEALMNTHDYMALIPVIEGAGGIITDWQGNILTSDSNGQIIAAANQNLHRDALAKLNHNG